MRLLQHKICFLASLVFLNVSIFSGFVQAANYINETAPQTEKTVGEAQKEILAGKIKEPTSKPTVSEAKKAAIKARLEERLELEKKILSSIARGINAEKDIEIWLASFGNAEISEQIKKKKSHGYSLQDALKKIEEQLNDDNQDTGTWIELLSSARRQLEQDFFQINLILEELPEVYRLKQEEIEAEISFNLDHFESLLVMQPLDKRAIQEALDKILATNIKEPVLGKQLLPVRRGALKEMVDATSIEANTYKAFPINVIPEEIKVQAGLLNNDPQAITHFVRSDISSQWYSGSRKGALGTLNSRAGNAEDKSDLLVQLLRAAGFEARYVYGEMRQSTTLLAEMLGVDVLRVEEALRLSGIAFLPMAYDQIVIDHTWVRWNDEDIDVFWNEKTSFWQGLGFNSFESELLRSNYLREPQKVDFGYYISSFFPLSKAVFAPKAKPQNIATSIQSVQWEGDELPQSRRVTVSIEINKGDKRVFFAQSFLRDIVNKQTSLSYIAANADDQRLIDAFGGLERTPPYLFKVVPALKIGGKIIEQSDIGVQLGDELNIKITFNTPLGGEVVEQNMIAGGYHVFGIGAPEVERTYHDDLSQEAMAASLLDGVAVAYAREWKKTEEQLNTWLGIVDFNLLPSLIMVNNEYTYNSVGMIKLSRYWRGVSIDALLRTAEPVSVLSTEMQSEQEAATRQWLRLSALQGSSLEHTVFEMLFRTEALSANKALTFPDVKTIDVDASNLSILKGFGHQETVIDAISKQVERGLTVRIIETPLSLPGWRGSAWHAEDDETGGSGYFLSGGLAGGVTLDQWQMPFVADTLRNAYHPLKSDPYSGVSMEITGNGQAGIVDKTLSESISVRVLDVFGQPVPDAPVVFIAVEGALGQGGSEGEEIETTTDAFGFATVSWRLGKHTFDVDGLATYGKINANDEYPTRYGVHRIIAWFASINGEWKSSWIQAVALPDTPVLFERIDQFPITNILPGDGVGANLFSIRDPFENPVANADVSAVANEPVANCPMMHSWSLEKALLTANRAEECNITLPVYGECGEFQASRRSNAYGQAVFNIFVGKVYNAVFPVTYTQGSNSLVINYQTTTTPDCLSHPMQLHTSYSSIADDVGLQAVAAGRQFPKPIGARLIHVRPKVQALSTGETCYFRHRSDVIITLPTTATAQFTVDNGGSATPAVRESVNGAFTSYINTASSPAAHQVGFSATAYNVVTDIITTPRTCSVEFTNGSLETHAPNIGTIYGLKATINSISPSPIRLNSNGANADPITFDFTIDPPTYPGRSAAIEIHNNEGLYAALNGFHSVGGVKQQSLAANSLRLDSTKRGWFARLVLNGGTHAETISADKSFSLDQEDEQIITFFNRRVDLYSYQDINNARLCQRDALVKFSLSRSARVTLTAQPYSDATPILDREPDLVNVPIVLIDDESYGKGTFAYAVPKGSLLPRKNGYKLVLTAVDAEDEHYSESKSGLLTVRVDIRDQLAVGSVMIKGVNTHNGVLVHQGPSIAVKGRGPKLTFIPTYSGASGSMMGPLGFNWDHNFSASITQNSCGDIVVSTGDTGAVLFIKDKKVWKPGVGYHATLIESSNGDAFDFYSKDGTHYHFAKTLASIIWANIGNNRYTETGQESASTIRDAQWRLASIEDPNGNKLTLHYEANNSEARLISVEDDTGRSFDFTYTEKIFAPDVEKSIKVIDHINGPGNLRLSFDYDELGNLVEIGRSGGLVEKYDYSTDEVYSKRHYITAITNGLGTKTDYDYVDFDELLPGLNNPLPTNRVESIRSADGGVTTFSYNGKRQDLEKVATVIERGDQDRITTYTLNKYGAPLKITSPAGTVNMVWKANDVLMERKTDARGTTTNYTYDAAGNILTERLSGNGATRNLSNTWRIQTTAPYIKNLLTRHTDGKSTAHSYTYDNAGNLLSETHGSGTARNVKNYTYDGKGDRVTMKDGLNNITTYTYDTYGLPKTITDPEGNVTSTNHDDQGRLVSQTDAYGNTTTLTYNDLDQLVRQVNPLGAAAGTREWTWDVLGNKKSETNEERRTWTFEYDEMGRLVTETHPMDGTRRRNYDVLGNLIRVTDWRLRGTTMKYDAAGRMIEKKGPLEYVWTYTYDENDNVLTETDPRDNTTRYAYDGLNRLTKRTDALGQITSRTWDDNGNMLTETLPNGTVTTQTFDAINRMTRQVVRGTGGSVTRSWTFDLNNNLKTEVDREGNTTSHDYDKANRRVKTTLPRVAAGTPILQFAYDKMGNVIHEIDARGNTTYYEYDALNRRTKVTLPETEVGWRSVRSYTYYNDGKLKTEMLENGNIIFYTYDNLGRLIAKHDMLGSLGAWVYDPNNNLTRERDGNGNETQHDYNQRNLKIQTRLPRMPVYRFTYDAIGNLKTESAPNGNVTRHEYDALNRKIKSVDNLGLIASWTHDAVGNLKTETDGVGRVVTHSYDMLNRRTESKDAIGVFWAGAYDGNGNLTRETDGKRQNTTYTYDTHNRKLSETKTPHKRTWVYDIAGNLAEEKDARNNTTQYAYNARNQKIVRIDPLKRQTRFINDIAGNPIWIEDESGRITRSHYDMRNRLSKEWVETENGQEITEYAYDSADNRIRETKPRGNAIDYGYDSHNHLIKITTAAGIAYLDYNGVDDLMGRRDGNGRLEQYQYNIRRQRIGTVFADGQRELSTYDLANRLIRTKDANGAVTEITYDGRHRETGRVITGNGETQSIELTLDANG
ncbi:MAG: hypothetical protein LBS40_07375, partial [Burkholderiales bacterium]|nr:hypothetical protein [Burkholderiales bacterium]